MRRRAVSKILGVSQPRFLSIGAIIAFFGVGLGAFGTHALRNRLSPEMLAIWQTGVQYHLIHAVALVAIGIAGPQVEFSPRWRLSGWLMLAGVTIFSGSLYVLALSGIKILGAITPLGGLCLLTGWICLATSAPRKS